jgi:hypothetical protein
MACCRAAARSGNCCKRAAQHHQIARAGHTQARAAHQTLDVAQFREDLAAGFARRLFFHQVFDGIVAAPDAGQVEQRKEQPATQKPAAHGGGGDVQGVEQGSLALALQHGFDELEVRARLLVNHQELVAAKEFEACHGQRCRELGRAHVAQNAAGGQAGLRNAGERVPIQAQGRARQPGRRAARARRRC